MPAGRRYEFEEMSYILCIDTGTDVCSVAIARDGKLLALMESSGERDHARNVAVYADELMRGNDIEPKELSAVAVAKGPGSYTGLRIGVSFAKGLCYSLGIPLIAVDSLESLARVAVEEHEAGLLSIRDWENALLCPMIDARRMEVYAEVFDTGLNRLTEVSAEVVDGSSFGAFIKKEGEFIVFGDGAAKTLDVLPREGVCYLEIKASARGLCGAAEEKLRAGETEDTAYFEPFYLKDFVVTASNKKVF